MKIDLNSDLGEGFGPWTMGDDDALLGIVTSANVACGYHAGDPLIMDRTVRAALANKVDLGAHVSFPDLAGCGRRPMRLEPREREMHILYQLGALEAIARVNGHKITHVNAHGALGNIVCAERDVADILVGAVRSFDAKVALLVLSNTELERAAAKAGVPTYNLFLADRAYDRTGQLVPRRFPGAVVKNEADVLGRVSRILTDGTVVSAEGEILKVEVNSILVHSDTAGAVELARSIRRLIESSGVDLAPMSAQ
ncbi:MAG: LamB/YcsF family protein [Rhodospirillales bacterium]